ncbi:LysM peptidoglycan-binding domain-containing protein [Chondromyces crocatus]|uniref:LysM peptidoglycan-binding domain-containing protein n=1 Tax=Chondromyces crocatus TaxID=52 RepID=UPI00067D18BE|nr:LysM domain-containing protein [Chondromyces crocatus]
MSLRRSWIAAFSLLSAALASSDAAVAFPHVVRSGETLAQIAERVYGRVQMEQVLVAANGLDTGSGVPITPGLRLEIPAVGHRRVRGGETWASLAEELLGAADRSDVLALSNDSMPWIEPADGQEILVPYNLRYVVGQTDTLLSVAYRFLGERDKAWMLDKYNHLKQKPLRRGTVILVPITQLPLTAAGREEASSSGALVRSEGAGQVREAQRRADAEIPLLVSDVRNGRYIDAVVRGNKVLGFGELATQQIATVQRQLVEAYVALDAGGLAETACGAWRKADPRAILDPVEISPKILRVCTTPGAMPPPDPEVDASLDAGAPPPDGGR